jgi:hypothetical protein
VKEGIAKTEGDVSLLQKLGATLVNFELGFEIVPGTATGPQVDLELNTYEVNDESIQMRGE